MICNRFKELLVTYEAHSYSGRAMYGKQCVSVRLESLAELPRFGATMMSYLMVEYHEAYTHNFYQVCVKLKKDMEELMEIFDHTRYDNLGMGFVVYWPELSWED